MGGVGSALQKNIPYGGNELGCAVAGGAHADLRVAFKGVFGGDCVNFLPRL